LETTTKAKYKTLTGHFMAIRMWMATRFPNFFFF